MQVTRLSVVFLIKKVIVNMLIITVVFCLAFQPALAETKWEVQVQPSGKTYRSPRMNYWIYAPDNLPENPPLVIYLHSSACMWNRALRDPLPAYITDNTITNVQAVVCVPQLCGDYGMYWRQEIESVDALIESVIEEYDVDPNRIVLAGYSLGGIGVWDLAAYTPGRYSRILSVCGRVNYDVQIENFISCDSVRVYTAHFDETINSATAITFANELAKQGVPASSYIVESDHKEAPKEIFKDEELLQWMWLVPDRTVKGEKSDEKKP